MTLHAIQKGTEANKENREINLGYLKCTFAVHIGFEKALCDLCFSVFSKTHGNSLNQLGEHHQKPKAVVNF